MVNVIKKQNEEAQLPPETQTGAMIFGCKINGKVFVPRDGRGKPGLIVQYAYLGTGPGGGWYLNIPATNWIPNPTEGCNIETDSLLVEEGRIYEFKLSDSFQRIKGTASAVYRDGTGTYPKLNNESGSLQIIKFDKANRILSGTFYFIGTNPSNNKKVQVTDGRFDIRF